MVNPRRLEFRGIELLLRKGERWRDDDGVNLRGIKTAAVGQNQVEVGVGDFDIKRDDVRGVVVPGFTQHLHVADKGVTFHRGRGGPRRKGIEIYRRRLREMQGHTKGSGSRWEMVLEPRALSAGLIDRVQCLRLGAGIGDGAASHTGVGGEDLPAHVHFRSTAIDRDDSAGGGRLAE